MALDFPNSPTLNQTFTAPSGVIWSWDGAKWANGTQASAYAPVASPTFTGDPKAPTPTQGDSDTSIATTAFVQAAVATALHDTGRNLLHNPLFNVAQRGAGPWTTDATYTLDRWRTGISVDTANFSRQVLSDADRAAVGDEQAGLALQNVFTGNAGGYHSINQPIEDVRRLAGKTVTISFWAKAASGTPKLGINILQAFGVGGSPSGALWAAVPGAAVTLSTTMARYSASIAIPSVVGKTFGTSGGDYHSVAIWYSSGAGQNANAGNIGVQSGTINIWGVQLEIGAVATPLEKPDPRYDLSNCQRFFQQLNYGCGGGSPSAGAFTQPSFFWPVTMRATPTVTPAAITYGNCSALIFGPTPNAVAGQVTATAAGNYYASTVINVSADL